MTVPAGTESSQRSTAVGSNGGQAAVGRYSPESGNEHVIPDTKGRQNRLLG